MNEPTLDALKQRIDRLEREARRWRCRAILVLILVAAVPLMGQYFPNAKVVEAHRFVLKGWDGKVRAILGDHSASANLPGLPWIPSSRDDSGWGLHIFGGDGGYRAGLVTDQGARLLLFDKNTAGSANLGITSGIAFLGLSVTAKSREQAEQEQAEWVKKSRAAKTSDEHLKLLMAEQKAMAPEMYAGLSVTTFEGGHTSLTFDERGKSRAVLGMTNLVKRHGVIEKRPLSSLVLFDKDSKVIWEAP